MLALITTNKYEKDVARAQKRGKDLSKLNAVIRLLLQEKPLPPKNRNHKIMGPYKGCWECHIEPDWLLIYDKAATSIICFRTGTHADLF